MDIRSPNMKKRIRRSDPQKQAHWEEVIRGWKESGQSVRGYCRAEGLRESAFYFWRRKLERRARSSGTVGQAPARASRRLSEPRRGTPSFLPVRVTGPVSESSGPAEAAPGVEIILARGCTIRVPQGFDRQTLADVLAVLEVRTC
jgi:transposase